MIYDDEIADRSAAQLDPQAEEEARDRDEYALTCVAWHAAQHQCYHCGAVIPEFRDAAYDIVDGQYVPTHRPGKCQFDPSMRAGVFVLLSGDYA